MLTTASEWTLSGVPEEEGEEEEGEEEKDCLRGGQSLSLSESASRWRLLVKYLRISFF
jgi:hypothetical protein